MTPDEEISRSSALCEDLSSAQVYALFKGFEHTGWSGEVIINVDGFEKSITFRRGAFAAARSQQIDDRLGEVLYRLGLISIDELSATAALVKRNRRFGQILIEGGFLNEAKLHLALQKQYFQILKSVFLAQKLTLQVRDKSMQMGAEVVFPLTPWSSVDLAYAHGFACRDFMQRINRAAPIIILKDSAPEGTFLGDFKKLLREAQDVESLVSMSKLTEAYTLECLLSAANAGEIAVNFGNAAPRVLGARAQKLKSRLDRYDLMLNTGRTLLSEQGVTLDTSLLKSYLASDGSAVPIELDETGAISTASFAHLLVLADAAPIIARSIAHGVDGLCVFLYQVLFDLVGAESMGSLTQVYEL